MPDAGGFDIFHEDELQQLLAKGVLRKDTREFRVTTEPFLDVSKYSLMPPRDLLRYLRLGDEVCGNLVHA